MYLICHITLHDRFIKRYHANLWVGFPNGIPSQRHHLAMISKVFNLSHNRTKRRD